MKNRKEKYKYFFKNYSLIFLPIVLIILMLVSQALGLFKKTVAEQELSYEKDHLEMAASFVTVRMRSAIYDLSVLSHNADFVQYISDNEGISTDEITQSWSNFLSAQDYYSEIRYFDTSGQQLLLVDKSNKSETTTQGFDFNTWEKYQRIVGLDDDEILTMILDGGELFLVKAVHDINYNKVGYLTISYTSEALFGDLQLLISVKEKHDYVITLNQEALVIINVDNVKVVDPYMENITNNIDVCTSQPVLVEEVSYQNHSGYLLDEYAIVHCFTTGERFEEVFPIIKYGGIGVIVIAFLIYGAFLNVKWNKEVQYQNATFLSNTLKIINKTLRHDVLNNITVIKFNLELLDLKNPLIGDVNDAVSRTTELIEDMRILEKNSLGDFFSTKVNLPKLIREIVVDFRDDLHIRVSGNGKVEVDSAFNSVVENIVRNVIFHARATKVDIRIFEEKEFVVIEFADDGKGVPEKLKIEIFEEGFKYGPTGHTGLGLFIVKTTVERYGGHVYVEDNLPKGSNFIIKLPK